MKSGKGRRVDHFRDECQESRVGVTSNFCWSLHISNHSQKFVFDDGTIFLIKMSQEPIWTRRFVGITTPQTSFVIDLHNFTLSSRQISVGIFVQHALERVKVYFVILYNLSKCLKATPLIWLKYEISSPFSFVIWGTLFLLISTLAWRWKNFVFLSPARNHKLLDLSLHVL